MPLYIPYNKFFCNSPLLESLKNIGNIAVIIKYHIRIRAIKEQKRNELLRFRGKFLFNKIFYIDLQVSKSADFTIV